MAKKPGSRAEFVFFNVTYEDGSQRSNRRVPADALAEGDLLALPCGVSVPIAVVPTSQRPVAPRFPVPSAPTAGGAMVREGRRSQAPRPPRTWR